MVRPSHRALKRLKLKLLFEVQSEECYAIRMRLRNCLRVRANQLKAPRVEAIECYGDSNHSGGSSEMSSEYRNLPLMATVFRMTQQ